MKIIPDTTRTLRFLSALFLTVVITACGSGDESSNPAGDNSGNNADAGTIEQQPDTSVGSTGDGSGLPGTDQGFIDEAVQRITEARSVQRNCGDTVMPAQIALVWDAKAELAAQGHSEWMQQTETFDHTGENDTSPGDRLTNAGYIWGAVAENIAAGYPSLQAVIDGWLNSPGHCRNIMSASVSEFAIALVNGNQSNTYSTYWTMLLADPL
ncbi:MAG: CAP domain-containing protein [Burkholderiaceae bacterium]